MVELDKKITSATEFSNIQSQYLSGVPIKRIEWKNLLDNISWDSQKQLLDHTVCLDLLKTYPLQTKYTLRFLRHIIDHLEATNQEVHDGWYEIYCEFQATNTEESKFSYRHYRVHGSDEVITLKESNSNISEGTTGLSVWGAAYVLAEWALENKTIMVDMNVLELGSGTGFTGLLICKMCQPKTFNFSDGNGKVLECLRQNVRNNFGADEKKIGVIDIDWHSVGDSEYCTDLFLNIARPDLIVASDIVYDNTLFRPLCQTIDYIFKQCQNKCRMILANAVRNEDTQMEFLSMLGQFGFCYEKETIQSPKYLYYNVDTGCPIEIYSIKRNCED